MQDAAAACSHDQKHDVSIVQTWGAAVLHPCTESEATRESLATKMTGLLGRGILVGWE
jgi:hypothetical protein